MIDDCPKCMASEITYNLDLGKMKISSTYIVTNICSQTNLVKKQRFVIMNVLVQISN